MRKLFHYVSHLLMCTCFFVATTSCSKELKLEGTTWTASQSFGSGDDFYHCDYTLKFNNSITYYIKLVGISGNEPFNEVMVGSYSVNENSSTVIFHLDEIAFVGYLSSKTLTIKASELFGNQLIFHKNK